MMLVVSSKFWDESQSHQGLETYKHKPTRKLK